VSYEPATNRLVGVATIFARATENLCSFNLDFQGMTVRSVVVDGKRAAWSRSQDHELTVTPGHALKKGRRFTTVVRYDGVPRTQQIILGPDFSIEAGFMHTDDGAVIAGEPEVAANWFPVNDHPIDKASYTFVVTVPAGLEVVGNGRLVAHVTHGRSTTWIWNAPEPMASYLATATMGQFDLHTYRTASGLRMYDAIDPDLFKEQVDPDDPASPTFGEIAEGSLARQGEILDFLSQQFGTPYPFSTGGGIVDDYDNLLFALENQTRTVYSKFFFTDSISGDSVVVHENAHQWFGDSVALAEWKHVWLDEGFATYAEWLWSQHEDLGTTQEIFDALYNGIPADDPLWQVVIGDPTVTFLFDNAVYLGGHDPPGAAQPGRRPRLLPDPAGLGEDEDRRQRHHRPVHRLGRAHLGPAARRPVPDLAVHRRQAGAGRGRRDAGGRSRVGHRLGRRCTDPSGRRHAARAHLERSVASAPLIAISGRTRPRRQTPAGAHQSPHARHG
jgi:hypothetical protein